MNPRFPLYIPSKGRADTRLTSRTLEMMGIPYFIIIEDQEYSQYSKVIDKSKILILDKTYQDKYNCCDTLGNSKSKGAGAARNFAWDHSVSLGAKWHWVMDDNIKYFFRFNKNLKVPVSDGTIFRCMEDFVLRYKNIAMAGPNYFKFVSRKSGQIPPFVMNTRIYSCNLIRNDVPFRWRGRFNEDTILSLDMLKARWCTVQFNAFLQDKATTQTIKGGNTTDIYGDGTLLKSEMIVRIHPDVSKVVWRFGRVHHHVDYKSFKERLIRRPDISAKGIDNYGMTLTKNSVKDKYK